MDRPTSPLVPHCQDISDPSRRCRSVSSPKCLYTKRSPISATAELLLARLASVSITCCMPKCIVHDEATRWKGQFKQQSRAEDVHRMIAALNRGRHLCSAGRPSRWALANISSSFFFLLSSPNLSGRRLDVYHTLAHGVALVRI